MTPKISIVIPVYNGERYIRRAIEGVLAQTFTDWELILVDDGSRDASGVICDEYAGERIHVVHQKNGGVSAARNAGIELAQGEYIAFVDADDIIGKDYLANLAQGFGSDLIITGFCYDYRPHTPLIGGGYGKTCRRADFGTTGAISRHAPLLLPMGAALPQKHHRGAPAALRHAA